MKFKDWLNKEYENLKEYNKPENVKVRLQSQIEVETLKAELEEKKAKRKEAQMKRFTIGDKHF